MRVLVCGGRDFFDRPAMWAYLTRAHKLSGFTELIHGAAMGADQLAGDWAAQLNVPTRTFPADWKKHGKRAGPIRNRRMLTEGKPDVVIAFPGGRGTANMVEIAKKAGVQVIEFSS